MTQRPKNATPKNLIFSYDVGHSSIGWAALEYQPQDPAIEAMQVLGCGVVTFPVDDCLANQRRAFRRQRRQIRATRQRIQRMKYLLEHMGALTKAQLDQPGCAWPWLLAAQTFRGERTLTWAELWDVLRWYAHNRGYDGNRAWSRYGDDDPEETARVNQGRALLAKYKTRSMAEAFCHILGINPADPAAKKASRARFREVLEAAFPRETVRDEVRTILRHHQGRLPGVDDTWIKALLDDWRALPCPAAKFPRRYMAGYLFGQLIPRFENRILTRCPFTNEKVPAKDCPEFYHYRWAMQLANVVVVDHGTQRPLTAAERQAIHADMQANGGLTASEFKKAVSAATGSLPNNLNTMLMHPEADKALVLSPARKVAMSNKNKTVFQLLPDRLQRRVLGILIRHGAIRLREIRSWLEDRPDILEKFDAALSAKQSIVKKGKGKKAKDAASLPQDPLDVFWNAQPESGRAPYARSIMKRVFDAVMAGEDPRAEGGVLYRSAEVLQRERERALEEQTNNHLIRHRLHILERLAKDMLKNFANGSPSRVTKAVIEVNSDLRTMSGMTTEKRALEVARRLYDFGRVKDALQKALGDKRINGKPIPITAGLLRKARIAMDLGMKCPYTGQTYDFMDIASGRLQRDHIIPYADRASDALSSQVLTFTAVNKWKGRRTAAQFIREEEGKQVEGMPNLAILPWAKYKAFVDDLDKGKFAHDDDQKRKKKRKELMVVEQYVDKEFLPADLTITSQLVRLGAQILEQTFQTSPASSKVVSMPGSVTGCVRRAWSLLGCIAKATPAVLDESGKPKPKGDIRNISHLHHAVDACVLGLTGAAFPRDGALWRAMVARTPTPAEAELLLATGWYERDGERHYRLCDLPSGLKNQIADRLAECRVYQHIPADMTGLKADQTVWRVVDFNDPHPSAQKLIRAIRQQKLDKTMDPDLVFLVHWKRKKTDQKAPKKLLQETDAFYVEYAMESKTKLMGLRPGKLQALKAAKIVTENYGIALDPEAQMIPFSHVWSHLARLRTANGGRPVRVLRKGSLIRVATGRFKGDYKIFSIKDGQRGLLVNMGPRDAVRVLDKMTHQGHYSNTLLASLQKGGLTILETDYTMA